MNGKRDHTRKDATFCDCMTHPFLNDPGVSQNGRIMEELDVTKVKIDARSTADLLLYLHRLSGQINYYDADLRKSDWKPFFEKSTPFVLADIIRFDFDSIQHQFDKAKTLFHESPGPMGLQYLQFFIYYNTLKRLSGWYQQIAGSDLPIQRAFENTLRDKIKPALLQFLTLNRLSARWYKTGTVDTQRLFRETSQPLLPEAGIQTYYQTGFEKFRFLDDSERLTALYAETSKVLNLLTDPIRLLTKAAALSLEQSIESLKEDLRENHPPHLALMFAFIKLFQILQGDLNQFTKKHLDYFYKDVLKLVSSPAVADKAHIVMGIQKELPKYLLKKGLLLSGGTDINNEDILFSLDDEIVVNHAQVKEVRTLFLNNTKVGANNEVLTEGLYIAPDARAADGIDKDFETEVKDYYTVGNRESKYKVPGTTLFKPYPSARIGLILASPVLMLKEGLRTVTIQLNCVYDRHVCAIDDPMTLPNSCCEDNFVARINQRPRAFTISAVRLFPAELKKSKGQPNKLPSINFETVHEYINQEYYYVSQELIAEAVKKGLDATVAKELQNFLTVKDPRTRGKDYCYCPIDSILYDRIIEAEEFDKNVPASNEVIQKFFQKRKPFEVHFSGEKAWIAPDSVQYTINQKQDNAFEFIIEAQLKPGQDAVTFFNAETLNEQLDTTLPLVRIMLDDHFKIPFNDDEEYPRYCLDTPLVRNFTYSLYHFFRHVRIDADSKIDVKVCGLRNFVVQNDESLQDVNSPIYPFGARPDILDFSVINSGGTYQISNAFLNSKLSNLTESTFSKLQSIIDNNVNKKKRVTLATTEKGLINFLDAQNITGADRNKIINAFLDVTNKLNSRRLVGPSFYIGSVETFGKKWNEVRVNFNWKDRPNSFNEYYSAYVAAVDENDTSKYKYGLYEEGFQINLSLLENGTWKPETLHQNDNGDCPEDTFTNDVTKTHNRLLFPDKTPNAACATPFCESEIVFTESIYLRNDYVDNHDSRFLESMKEVSILNVNSRDAFLKVTLQNQDFLHKDYPYVLARQMLASGKLPDETVEDAVYYDTNGDPVVIDSDKLLETYKEARDLSVAVDNQVNVISGKVGDAGDPIDANPADDIRDAMNILDPKSGELKSKLETGADTLDGMKSFSAIIPNEPWTPIISAISIDYTATAEIEDIDLIHLYAFDNTHKREQIDTKPTLLPTYCDEGSLFLGIEQLTPPTNLSLLFQLAEATADSELPQGDVRWHYLDKNVWRPLRTGFEIIEDETNNLTSTGIIKLALPGNINTDNTIMPKGLHWIRASIHENSPAISETTAIYAQAVRATFTNTTANDKSRLTRPLEAGQISRLEVADANVNQVLQPYPSFGGRLAEDQDLFYVRASEHLRHKGRAIQKFDYERIALHAFPQIFRAKCINHSIGLNAHDFLFDFPYAPGFIILAVIPDLTKLKAGNSFEPRVPLPLLEEIDDYFRKITSPFVRIRTMNPRYEKVHLCLRVRLMPGKDEGYFKAKLEEDLRRFFAPWTIGEAYHYKLTFGQCVNSASVISFIESLEYIDFLLEIKIGNATVDLAENIEICPTTPRSIIVAGEIEICIDRPKAPQWCPEEKCLPAPVRINPCAKPSDVIL